MKTITVTIDIHNVGAWDIDWSDKDKAVNELMELNDDIKRSIARNCGIEYRNMTINSTLKDY